MKVFGSASSVTGLVIIKGLNFYCYDGIGPSVFGFNGSSFFGIVTSGILTDSCSFFGTGGGN
jgi:hypothetical protein